MTALPERDQQEPAAAALPSKPVERLRDRPSTRKAPRPPGRTPGRWPDDVRDNQRDRLRGPTNFRRLRRAVVLTEKTLDWFVKFAAVKTPR